MFGGKIGEGQPIFRIQETEVTLTQNIKGFSGVFDKQWCVQVFRIYLSIIVSPKSSHGASNRVRNMVNDQQSQLNGVRVLLKQILIIGTLNQSRLWMLHGRQDRYLSGRPYSLLLLVFSVCCGEWYQGLRSRWPMVLGSLLQEPGHFSLVPKATESGITFYISEDFIDTVMGVGGYFPVSFLSHCAPHCLI